MKAAIYYIPLILILCSNCTLAQTSRDSANENARDSSLNVADVSIISMDTSVSVTNYGIKSYFSITKNLLSANKFINVRDSPVYLTAQNKKFQGKEFVFYILCLVVLILGILKTFYRGYFTNLFRVFFNTSLRQTQLTDQLLQAKFPSFLLNIFFSISAGVFIWLLFTLYRPPALISRSLLLPFCILGIGLLYFIKYCILKFIGWVSSMQQTVDSFIFIIFLVNKVSGIVLVPFLIILAFSMPFLVHYVTTISLLVVLLFFLSRYIKTYAVLEHKFPLNGFHFLIYIFATEIIPLVLLYKITIDYLL
ncbi:MAG: DUF4271 domain-containing protein [Ginsengibacter sp.]